MKRLLPCLLLVTTVSTGDLFSSIHDLEAADRNEKSLLHGLMTFNRMMKNKINPLSQAYVEITSARRPEMNRSEYLADPVNAFSLIRRLVKQWPLLLALMSQVDDVSQMVEMLPTEDQYQGALRGVSRLQEVYTLDLSRLTGTGGSLLTAGDCLSMGQYLSHVAEYTKARRWLEQALLLVSQGDLSVGRSQVLPFLFLASSFSSCDEEDVGTQAIDLLHELLTDTAAAELMFSSADLSTQFRHVILGNCTWREVRRAQMIDGFTMAKDTARLYNEMCNGFRPSDLPPQHSLQCYLVSHGNPRLLLAPFKMEELHVHPPIYQFHDVISDQEIKEIIQASSEGKTDCATITDDRPQLSSYRVCNVAWVRDEDSPTAAVMTRRAADMTGLDMLFSEPNQVAMYGLGGEFKLHQDPLPNNTLSSEDQEGNRLATLMFYMNDVPAGGRTIFPYINVAVTPLKGSAVLWFNLDREGRMLPEVFHGGCPVLKGSKWVLNKWIHEGNQDFEKTCPSKLLFPHSYYLETRKNIS